MKPWRIYCCTSTVTICLDHLTKAGCLSSIFVTLITWHVHEMKSLLECNAIASSAAFVGVSLSKPRAQLAKEERYKSMLLYVAGASKY